ncbi:class I SAM-dependent methyltransferase [Microscilla marina]|uniref:Methyltransferase domain-containing protein n=1 Tax=Microscilla marina ATCC 23134 TaxID=313606 RepID=A1ZHW9_MICM2|nr:class I SAM-dependent methyltransferase [Microscilla marina]EAY30126.1 hypothetical protein M23134_05459 [Microscilla marina ATCC 23134]
MKQLPKLLPEEELVWSPIVANNRMNRERQASGVNSYENEVGFCPKDWLRTLLAHESEACWLDVCCGKGNALLQTAQALASSQGRLHLHGVDLVDFFAPIPEQVNCIRFFIGSITHWQPPLPAYHLITCIHGLHYVGDKLGAIARLGKILAPGGKMVASFDLASVQVGNDAQGETVLEWFRQAGIEYDAQKKLIIAQAPLPHVPSFAHAYLGANDRAGKNYTGQEAVTAYYAE